MPEYPNLIWHEPRFEFGGWKEYNTMPGVCDMRVFLSPEGKHIALATEHFTRDGKDAAEGQSVTNGIEYIAAALTAREGFHFSALLEHYPPSGARARRPDKVVFSQKEEWALVTFERFDGRFYHEPTWKHVDRAVVESLVGGALPLIFVDGDMHP